RIARPTTRAEAIAPCARSTGVVPSPLFGQTASFAPLWERHASETAGRAERGVSMTDRSPGRGASTPEAGPSCAAPSHAVKDATAARPTRVRPRRPAPLIATAPSPPAAPTASPVRDQLAALARQGAYVVLLDRTTGEPICEPTRDPAAITQAWDANQFY